MSPYRQSAFPLIRNANKKSWTRKLRRKFLIWWHGKYLKRRPDICPKCFKHAKADCSDMWEDSYSPCGHTYGIFDQVQENKSDSLEELYSKLEKLVYAGQKIVDTLDKL